MNEQQVPTKDYALIVALEALVLARLHSSGQATEVYETAIELIKLIFRNQE